MSIAPEKPAPGAVDYDRYRKLLAEAETLKGTSLWQDAWRRLKRNRLAMASLAFLTGLIVVAVSVPLLPLQSPSLQDLDQQFAGPNFSAVRLEAATATGDREPLSKLRSDFYSQADVAKNQAANPLNRFWSGLDPLARALTSLRLAIFGDWCAPSICGRDALGRDVLSRIFWGARISLLVGVAATIVSLVIGVSYGAISGYAGGSVDQAMMRIVDVLYAVPFLFIVIFAMSIISEREIKQALDRVGIGTLTVFLALIGLVFWLTMARVVRGQVLSLKNELFVDAARVLGAGSGRIVFYHLIPNVLGIVIVNLTLTIPSVMLFEASLSFLGLGIKPPDVSWGLLMKDAADSITPIRTRWWLVLFPGLALSTTMFALNYLGDGLRDVLDPRLKNKH